MSPSLFLQKIADPAPLILDGAMGTELTRRGVNLSLPLWSAGAVLYQPETVRQIHLDYLMAGADILTTATFRTESHTFRKAGLDSSQARDTCRQAVTLCQQAIQASQVDRSVLIAGSMAPLEDCYHPELVPEASIIRACQSERANWLAEAGVDLLLLETMNNRREIEIATAAALQTGLPVITSLLIRDAEHLFDGSPLEVIWSDLAQLGVNLIGINCVHHSLITQCLCNYSSLSSIPICVYPNADYYRAGSWIRDKAFTPDNFAHIAEEWLAKNVKIIGGCCGTDPRYIAALSHHLRRKLS